MNDTPMDPESVATVLEATRDNPDLHRDLIITQFQACREKGLIGADSALAAIVLMAESMAMKCMTTVQE